MPMSFFRRWKRVEPDSSRPTIDERVEALVASFVPADALDKERAREVAQGVLVEACREFDEAERAGNTPMLPSSFEIGEWDRVGLVTILVETVGKLPNAWASDVARVIVDLGFQAKAPQRFLDGPDVLRLVGL